jgi:hypothetical protein
MIDTIAICNKSVFTKIMIIYILFFTNCEEHLHVFPDARQFECVGLNTVYTGVLANPLVVLSVRSKYSNVGSSFIKWARLAHKTFITPSFPL